MSERGGRGVKDATSNVKVSVDNVHVCTCIYVHVKCIRRGRGSGGKG